MEKLYNWKIHSVKCLNFSRPTHPTNIHVLLERICKKKLVGSDLFLNFEALFFFTTGHNDQINLWKVKFSLTSKKISKLLLTPKNMHACFLPYFAKMCLISRKNCAIRFSHNFSHFSVNLNSNWCCDLFIIIAIIHSKHAISLCRYNSVPPTLY